jgi:hypothetical protein
LFRPATLDLILTKMMRGDDPQDMTDIEFLIAHDGIKPVQLEEAFGQAVLQPHTIPCPGRSNNLVQSADLLGQLDESVRGLSIALFQGAGFGCQGILSTIRHQMDS